MDAIKNQGEKQLVAIERQKENKPKVIEKEKKVYLEDETGKFFEMYPKSFTSQNKTLLRKLAENESSINHRNLFYKILLPDGRFHEFDFFKKYGTLYNLLEIY